MTALDGPREQLVALCRELIQIPSEPPAEGGMAAAVERAFKTHGFRDITVDRVGNVIGRLPGREAAAPKILFDAHLDTVGVTDAEQWSVDPYAGVIRDDRLYGRGSADMKGALAAMIVGLGQAAREEAFDGDVYVVGSLSEELIEGPALQAALQACRPDLVVIGEATDLHISVGQRGRLEVTMETLGRPAHSSSPHLGLNAVKMMAVLINALDDLPMPEDADLGRALIEVTDIQSTPYPGISVVPDRCRATFDRRLLMGETAESVLSEIQALVDRLQQQDGNFRVRVEVARADVTTYTGHRLQAAKFAPAWMTDRNHPLVRKAAAGLAGAGISPRFGTYQFCTNGSYAAVVEGITTIGFGPGQEEQAHTIDEFVTVDQLLQAAAGYAAMARSAGRAVS